MSSRPKIIGITGTIASGKSLVGRILEDKGIVVIDTDKVAHKILAEDEHIRHEIITRFGTSVCHRDGSINRTALGAVVFNDSHARRDLESIIHPAVRADVARRIERLTDQRVVAVLVPLLFEAGLESEYDEVWTVYTEPSILRRRLHSRDNLTESDIDARLSAQWPQEKKMAAAHKVIDNSGTEPHTAQQVYDALSTILGDETGR